MNPKPTQWKKLVGKRVLLQDTTSTSALVDRDVIAVSKQGNVRLRTVPDGTPYWRRVDSPVLILVEVLGDTPTT